MLVLPLIDLLILLGWTTLSIGAVMKAIYVTTSYRPTLIGLTPLDCAIAAGVFLLLALALAARTWVKLNEPKLVAARRSQRVQSAYDPRQEVGQTERQDAPPSPDASLEAAPVGAANRAGAAGGRG